MCHNIQSNKIPQSTRLRLETERTNGKIFSWKYDHPKTTKPIQTIFKVESNEKQDTNRMTGEDFITSFSQFKKGSQ